MAAQIKKRKSGIPTGNAGEYFVMGELLRRGFDAQLADRNTKGYDLLVGRSEGKNMRKIQVKTKRTPPWYVKQASFKGTNLNQVTVYVLIGPENGEKPVRYFIAKNHAVAQYVHRPSKKWRKNAFMPMKAVEKYEGRWDTLLK